jgi:hypothetical protein
VSFIGLIVTLVAAPAIYLWQTRIARRALMDAAPPQG